MIFFFILIFGVFFLFFNVRMVAPGIKGSVIAGISVILLPLCFLFRTTYFASLGMSFFAVWLSEALFLYILWWIARGIRRAVVKKPLDQRVAISVARLLFFVSVLLTVIFRIAGTAQTTISMFASSRLPSRQKRNLRRSSLATSTSIRFSNAKRWNALCM